MGEEDEAAHEALVCMFVRLEWIHARLELCVISLWREQRIISAYVVFSEELSCILSLWNKNALGCVLKFESNVEQEGAERRYLILCL